LIVQFVKIYKIGMCSFKVGTSQINVPQSTTAPHTEQWTKDSVKAAIDSLADNKADRRIGTEMFSRP
jgi:hypothetical protein